MRKPGPTPTGTCACGCGTLLPPARGKGCRFPLAYASKACANRDYHRRVRSAQRKAQRAATTPPTPPTKKHSRYYDLKPEVMERVMAQALARVQWEFRQARDRMTTV